VAKTILESRPMPLSLDASLPELPPELPLEPLPELPLELPEPPPEPLPAPPLELLPRPPLSPESPLELPPHPNEQAQERTAGHSHGFPGRRAAKWNAELDALRRVDIAFIFTDLLRTPRPCVD